MKRLITSTVAAGGIFAMMLHLVEIPWAIAIPIGLVAAGALAWWDYGRTRPPAA